MTVPTLPAGPLIPDTRACTSFTIDGIEMLRSAWCLLDVAPVISQEAPQRGTDRQIPGGGGVIAYPRYRAIATGIKLDLALSGAVQMDGTPTAVAELDQLQLHLDYLNTNIVAPVNPLVVPDGTRVAVVTKPDTSTITGTIHVCALTWKAQVGPVAVYTLDIDIPDGKLF